MSSDRIIDELAALRYPMDTTYGLDDDAVNKNIQEERESYARQLRNVRDRGLEIAEPDPVLGALMHATHDIRVADERRRVLIAYANKVLPGRGYSLDAIAGACDMSASGVRTAFTDRHIDKARDLIEHTTDTTDKEEA